MIKPHIDDPERCAALGRIQQTPDGPNWAAADPGDVLLAEKLIAYYWRFALNVAGKELKRQNANTLPRSAKNRVSQHQEEYADDETADPNEPGDRPGDEYVLDGTGLYRAEFESDIPRLVHKAGHSTRAELAGSFRHSWPRLSVTLRVTGRSAGLSPE
jgi:hypothetical protein